jgi:hypothetical protein
MEATAIKLKPPDKIIEQALDLLIGTGYKVILAGDFKRQASNMGR